MRADRLVEDLWAADAVATRRNTLQSKVAMLRRALGDPAAIASRDGGYALAVDPANVDALAVLRRRGRRAPRLLEAGDDRGAADLCASALGRFRGDVLQAAATVLGRPAPNAARGGPPAGSSRPSSRRGCGSGRPRPDRRAGGGGCGPSVPGGPVGAADHRAVPSGPSGRRAGGVPAGPGAARRRARPGPRPAAAASSSTGSWSRTPRSTTGRRRTGAAGRPSAGNLPSMAAELVGRDDEIAAVSDLLATRAAGGDRRSGRDREDRARDRGRRA